MISKAADLGAKKFDAQIYGDAAQFV